MDRTLATITNQAGRLKEVRKEELNSGDWVVVTTLNSIYSFPVLEGALYSISGVGLTERGSLATEDDQ